MKQKTDKQMKSLMDEIERILAKLRVSGILYIPNYGTMSLFANETDKVRVLEHAKIEFLSQDLLNQKKAELWAQERFNKELAKHNNQFKDREYIN